MFVTDALKQAYPGLFILPAAGKLNAVIGQEGVDFTGAASITWRKKVGILEKADFYLPVADQHCLSLGLAGPRIRSIPYSHRVCS